MKKCSNCNIQFEDTKIYCPNCGNLLEPVSATGKNKKSVIMLVLLVISILGNIGLGLFAFDLNNDRSYYSSKYWDVYLDYDSLQSKYDDLKKGYNFFYKYARIIPDDGSGQYHRYGCEKLDTSSFWIYNREIAVNKATPCQDCCSDDAQED